jgi:hypothetical protein
MTLALEDIVLVGMEAGSTGQAAYDSMQIQAQQLRHQSGKSGFLSRVECGNLDPGRVTFGMHRMALIFISELRAIQPLESCHLGIDPDSAAAVLKDFIHYTQHSTCFSIQFGREPVEMNYSDELSYLSALWRCSSSKPLLFSH